MQLAPADQYRQAESQLPQGGRFRNVEDSDGARVAAARDAGWEAAQ
jgi:hypothetical protein